MERKNFHVNDDSNLEAQLRAHFAAPPLADDNFTRGVLAELPAKVAARHPATAYEAERREAVRRGWFAAIGALVGAGVFAAALCGAEFASAMLEVGAAARHVSDGIGDAASTASNVVWPTTLALAAALGAVGFVFWSELRRWVARQWEQLA